MIPTDIAPITEFPQYTHYSKGTIKVAELLITLDDHYIRPQKRNGVFASALVDVRYEGILQGGQTARTLKAHEAIEGLNARNAEELEHRVNERSAYRATVGDIVPVYWLSPEKLPSGLRLVRLARGFRTHGTPANYSLDAIAEQAFELFVGEKVKI